MPITPDTKNWTWVLERACPDCGFDATSFDPTRTGAVLREQATTWAQLLADPRASARPTDSQWSALEYGCHLRDVFRLYDERLRLMLTEDDPGFANWDQDETAITDRYDQQDPAVVAVELADAARVLADRFDAVDGAQWQRTGSRSDGASFTVDSFARYFVHDPVHHVGDVARGYRMLGPA